MRARGAAPQGTPEVGFGVYVHWPFCKAKCPYCDFNSHVRQGGTDADGFAAALARELEHMAGRTPGRWVTSVFFGGGTPSLMPPAAVGRVLDTVGRLWPVAAEAEVTLEANPTSAEARNFSGYRAAGVNRLSVGVQALDDADLHGLGRQHTAEEALAAFRLAARTFPRASFDLIYARPRQTPQRWRRELERAIAEAAGHLSLYQLTIEPGTRFAELHERGRLAVPDEEESLALYEIAQELCAAAGLAAYEVSNHARAGEESRPKRLYWRYGEYAGVGPGAHGRLLERGRRTAVVTEAVPETWRAAVARHGQGIAEETPLSDRQAAEEMLLMGLRLAEGLDLARLEAETGHAPGAPALAALADAGLVDTVIPAQGGIQCGGTGRSGDASRACRAVMDPGLRRGDEEGCGIGRATQLGLRRGDDRRLVATPRGRLVLNAVVAELAAALAPVKTPGSGTGSAPAR